MITTTLSRLRKQSKSKRRRRGGTLVVVAIMFTVLMGISAMALDFSRMYEFRAQIKTLADAAAMSAILDRKVGRTESTAETNAFALIPINRVEGSGQATMVAADIEPVMWHPPTRIANDTPWNLANAVRASTHYTSNYTMARLFGATTKTLNDTSIALFGSLVTSACIKPIAIPYASVLKTLDPSMTTFDMSYNLTANDIATLRNPSNVIQFTGLGQNDYPNGAVPGNFGWIDTDVSGETNKRIQIANGLTGCSSGDIGVGSTISGITGEGSSNHVQTAISTLCGEVPPSEFCDATKPPILIVIYSTAIGQGDGALFTVKYIGAFKFVRRGTGGNKGDLFGYLTATDVAPSGEVSPIPGPANVKPQLVK